MHLSPNLSPPCAINAESGLFMQKVAEVVQAGLKAKLWSGGHSGDSAKPAHKFPERKSDPLPSVLMQSSSSQLLPRAHQNIGLCVYFIFTTLFFLTAGISYQFSARLCCFFFSTTLVSWRQESYSREHIYLTHSGVISSKCCLMFSKKSNYFNSDKDNWQV